MRDYTDFDLAGKNNHYPPKPPPNVPKYIKYVNRAIILSLVFWGISCIFSPDEESPDSPSKITKHSSSETDSTELKKQPLVSPSKKSSVTNSFPMDTNATPLNSDSFKISARKKDKALTSSLVETDSTKTKFWSNQKDPKLAKKLNEMMEHYHPDGAFYLVIDAKTNEILAWAQRNDSAIQEKPTYLNMSPFPAASLIKTLSAGAAMEYNRYGAASQIPMIGRKHTLYKRQLIIPKNYKGPTISLEDAFASSANPIFGIIGQQLGADRLINFSKKIGFNTKWPRNLPNMSNFSPPSSGFGLPEAASGFTQENTISPILAAAICRAILTGEQLQIPWSKHLDKAFVHSQSMSIGSEKISKNTLYGLKRLFLRTVTHGTARRAIKKIVYSYNRSKLDIGGKTGTLDGSFPRKARYDWFMGFAREKKNPKKGCIIVVMQYHFDKRTLPSSQIAGLIVNHWAKLYTN